MNDQELMLNDYIQIRAILREHLLFMQERSNNPINMKHLTKLREHLIQKLDNRIEELKSANSYIISKKRS